MKMKPLLIIAMICSIPLFFSGVGIIFFLSDLGASENDLFITFFGNSVMMYSLAITNLVCLIFSTSVLMLLLPKHVPYIDKMEESHTKLLTAKKAYEEIREKLLVKLVNITCDDESLDQISIGEEHFKRVISKLPHNPKKLYYYDFLRCHIPTLANHSYSELTKTLKRSGEEYYAVALVQILDELKFQDTMNLTKSDIYICQRAIVISQILIAEYNNMPNEG